MKEDGGINYPTAITALANIMKNIADEPSDPKFRHLPKTNTYIQREIVNVPGGLEFLYAVGFREKKLTLPRPGVYFALEEPNAAEDVNAWLEWFEELKRIAELVCGEAQTLKRHRRGEY